MKSKIKYSIVIAIVVALICITATCICVFEKHKNPIDNYITRENIYEIQENIQAGTISKEYFQVFTYESEEKIGSNTKTVYYLDDDLHEIDVITNNSGKVISAVVINRLTYFEIELLNGEDFSRMLENE